jgi:hypothetical protein
MQNLAVVHFNPANILKRMNYSVVEQAKSPVQGVDTAEPAPEDIL